MRTIPNPADPRRPLRPAELITDRAKRYRANQPGTRPPGPHICVYCGRRSNNPRSVMVGHIDGDESHAEPENLAWTCRRCNTMLAAAMHAAGIGERTNQQNPKRKRPTVPGAHNLAQWVSAVRIATGQINGNVPDAVAMIRATPAEDRSSFAEQIWDLRREHGTDKIGVPF